jgi:protein phosphatase
VRIRSGRATDQGRSRENNEDALLVDENNRLYAVADGMGGHAAGEVASRTAIEALRAAYAAGTPIDAAIERAHNAVLERAATDDDLAGMGTTMTAVTVKGPRQLLVGHVGDSRAYLLREGTLERVTEDHSLVEQLVREGRLTSEQAEAHPQRAIVTRALGVEPDVEVDTYTVDVESGDRMIICSDGLNTMLRDRDVERIARTETDPQRAAETLVAAANDAGGEDNITVVVIDVDDVDTTEVQPRNTAATEDPAPVAAPIEPIEPATATATSPSRSREGRSRLRTLRGAVLGLLPLVLVLGIATAALGG